MRIIKRNKILRTIHIKIIEKDVNNVVISDIQNIMFTAYEMILSEVGRRIHSQLKNIHED